MGAGAATAGRREGVGGLVPVQCEVLGGEAQSHAARREQSGRRPKLISSFFVFEHYQLFVLLRGCSVPAVLGEAACSARPWRMQELLRRAAVCACRRRLGQRRNPVTSALEPVSRTCPHLRIAPSLLSRLPARFPRFICRPLPPLSRARRRALACQLRARRAETAWPHGKRETNRPAGSITLRSLLCAQQRPGLLSRSSTMRNDAGPRCRGVSPWGVRALVRRGRAESGLRPDQYQRAALTSLGRRLADRLRRRRKGPHFAGVGEAPFPHLGDEEGG